MCNDITQEKSELTWKYLMTEAERLLRGEKDRQRRKELKLAVKELKWLIKQKAAMPRVRKTRQRQAA